MQETDTRDRLLDAAERLFGTLGIAETSLRAITKEAGTNLAAVNYHFGSKDALVVQTFMRRLEPLNRERLRLLDEAERSAGEEPAELESVVTAFVAPTLRMVYESQHGESFLRMMGRLHVGPPDKALRIIDQFDEVFRLFAASLSRILPDLSLAELHWRLFFLVGSMTMPMMAGHIIKLKSHGQCDPANVEDVTAQLVAYISGGLRAPGLTTTEDC